jgi:hypothetical protein
MRWVAHVAHGERTTYRILMGNPKGKRPLGRPRRRLEDNVKMDLSGRGWGDIDLIDLVQGRDYWGCSCEHGN